jgi:stearoyl-CoA desaturase (delta-9 desaturase)
MISRISFHTKLQTLWILSHGFLAYALIARPSLTLFLAAMVWTVIVNIGSEAGAHRLFAHRAYETPAWKKNALIFLQTWAGEGSVLAFCGVHRQHHAEADKPLDPHSPVQKPAFSIVYWLHTIHVNPRFIKDCLRDKAVVFQHVRYFQLHFLAAAGLLYFGGPAIYGYFISLPIVLILYGNAATNIFGHTSKLGYRNFETDDRSVNIGGLLNFLLMGGGLQNNHHARPASYTNKVKDVEKDSMGWIVETFLKAQDR